MSNEYLNKTEEQQFEDAKSWFKENGTPILLAICVACAASFGWTFWQNHQAEKAASTSASYQATMESYLQDPAKNTPLAEKFVADNNGSNYASFTQLELAKQAAEKGDYATAKTLLNKTLQSSQDATLQIVTRFRLAAVDFQLKNYDEALTTLGQIQDKGWELRKQLLTGDILAAKGDTVAAKSAYEQAKVNANEQDKVLIDLRINNL